MHKPLAAMSRCDSAVYLIKIKYLTGGFFGFVLQEEIIPILSSVCCLYIWWSAPNEQTSKIWTEETTSALVTEPCRLQVGISSHQLPLTVVREEGLGFFAYNTTANVTRSSPRNGISLVLLLRVMSWSTPHHWNDPLWLARSYGVWRGEKSITLLKNKGENKVRTREKALIFAINLPCKLQMEIN